MKEDGDKINKNKIVDRMRKVVQTILAWPIFLDNENFEKTMVMHI